MIKTHPGSYWIAGALSGVVWFAVAMVLDNCWAMSEGNWLLLTALALAGAATGEVISLLFRRLFSRRSKVLFFLMPLVTLPVAIALFAVLVWLMRQSLGVHFSVTTSPLSELYMILETYLFVLISIFAPFLYGLALLNQCVMRGILRKQISH